MTGTERPRRPVPLPAIPDSLAPTGPDPATLAEERRRAADAFARALLAAAATGGPGEVDRLVGLADEVGLDDLDSAWRGADNRSPTGGLRVLYLLQAWVRAQPDLAVRLVEAGRVHADVAATVLGVPEVATADDLRAVADDLVRGALSRDLPTALHRGAALCRLVAAGRGASSPPGRGDLTHARTVTDLILGSRLLSTAEDLDAAAHAAGHVSGGGSTGAQGHQGGPES